MDTPNISRLQVEPAAFIGGQLIPPVMAATVGIACNRGRHIQRLPIGLIPSFLFYQAILSRYIFEAVARRYLGRVRDQNRRDTDEGHLVIFLPIFVCGRTV